MLTLYIVSAAVAGALLLLSLMGMDHGAGHDIHIEHDHDSLIGQAYWLPFFSLRFYTYFFAGFGATGVLIHYLTATPEMLTLWLALAVGLVAGLSVTFMVRLLRKGETSSGTNENDVLGIEAQVLVTIRGNTPGRIRCIVKGDAIDYLATSTEPTPLEAGAAVIVVAMENGRALVMPRSALFDDEPLPNRTTSL